MNSSKTKDKNSKNKHCEDGFTDSPIELITKPELFKINHINVKFEKHRRQNKEKEKKSFWGILTVGEKKN